MIQRALGQTVLEVLVNKELNILADLQALIVGYQLAKSPTKVCGLDQFFLEIIGSSLAGKYIPSSNISLAFV